MKRLNGLDYIKALMSVFVVAWHSGGGGFTVIGDKENFQTHLFSAADLFSFQILLLAVPLFMLTSNFLFLSRNPDMTALKIVLHRYFMLLVFWVVLSHLFFGGYEELLGIFPKKWQQVVPFIFTGGYTLYYFMVSLIITQLIGYRFVRAGTPLVVAFLLISCALIFIIPLIAVYFSIPKISLHWNPLNFLPYPFIAILIARHNDWVSRNRMKIAALLIFLTISFIVIEWAFYRNAISGYPAYTRLSLVTQSAIVMTFALNPKIMANRVVRFMSDHSFGLYTLHRFVKTPLFPVILPVLFKIDGGIPAPDLLARWIAIFIVILISYVFSLALRFVLRDGLI
ncbi:MAG: acyltransferase family protein [Chloroflexi bacterium]|nr:acyltransferase family protein [Chloroflexota bacterium]